MYCTPHLFSNDYIHLVVSPVHQGTPKQQEPKQVHSCWVILIFKLIKIGPVSELVVGIWTTLHMHAHTHIYIVHKEKGSQHLEFS